jgi:hypothetical protein
VSKFRFGVRESVTHFLLTVLSSAVVPQDLVIESLHVFNYLRKEFISFISPPTMNVTFERKKNTLYTSSLNAILHYKDLNVVMCFAFFNNAVLLVACFYSTV